MAMPAAALRTSQDLNDCWDLAIEEAYRRGREYSKRPEWGQGVIARYAPPQ